MDHNRIISYTPQGSQITENGKQLSAFNLMIREMVEARELIWRLFLRDFSAKYRQSALGIVWALFAPLVTIGMFLGINRAGVLKIEGIDIPYALYAIIGLSIWNLFSTGLTACSTAIVNAGSMVVKINFPKIALVIASSFQGIVEFLIRVILIIIAFIWYKQIPNPVGLILGLSALIPMYLYMTGFGFFLSLATGVLRDVVNLLNMALMGIMLLSPVLYPLKGESFLARLNTWNPFNYLINVPRDLIVKGNTSLLSGYLWCSIISLLVFIIGWRLFYLAQTKIAERV